MALYNFVEWNMWNNPCDSRLNDGWVKKMPENITEILTEIDDYNSMSEDTCFSSDVLNCWHSIQNSVDLCVSRRHLADSG